MKEKTVVYRFSKHGNPQKPLFQLSDGRLVRMRGPDYVFYEFHEGNVVCWAVWLRKISYGVVKITKSKLRKDGSWEVVFERELKENK